MKVNSINKSSISHKAYIKPNELFRDLYAKSAKTKELRTLAETFRNNLPKQELEILKCNNNMENYLIYDVKNNITQKVHRAFITKDKINKPRYGACELLASLIRLNSTDFYRENTIQVTEASDIFDIITRP